MGSLTRPIEMMTARLQGFFLEISLLWSSDEVFSSPHLLYDDCNGSFIKIDAHNEVSLGDLDSMLH